MKAIATLALISLAYASEDNEFFKFNNTKIATHHNQAPTEHLRPHLLHPIHRNGSHNANVKPKPLRPVRPVFFNKTQELSLHKPIKAFDDEELFALEELAENELRTFVAAQEPEVKKVDIVTITNKILARIFSSFDDEEEDQLFALKEIAENELNTYIVQSPEVKKEQVVAITNKILARIFSRFDDEEEDELFNLGGLINDGLNIYGDIRNKDYGSLVNHGFQTIRDIKKHHDDEELFHAPNKGFLGPL